MALALRVLARPVLLRAFSVAPALAARPRQAVSLNTESAGPLHENKKKAGRPRATASKGKKAAKKPKPAKKRKVAKKPKVYTLRTQISRQVKALSSNAALVAAPLPKPVNLYIKQATSGGQVKLADAARQWTELSDSDKQRYVQQADQARSERDSAARSLTEEDATALRALIKLRNKRVEEKNAKDGKTRTRKHFNLGSQQKKTNAYSEFVKRESKTAEIQALPSKERFAAIAKLWHQQKA